MEHKKCTYGYFVVIKKKKKKAVTAHTPFVLVNLMRNNLYQCQFFNEFTKEKSRKVHLRSFFRIQHLLKDTVQILVYLQFFLALQVKFCYFSR